MNYKKSIIFSLVLALNAYVASSQSRIIQSESGLLTLQIPGEGDDLYEHNIFTLSGFDLIEYNISSDSIISIIYIPKKRSRIIVKDAVFISVYKMVELNELYIKNMYSASFSIKFDDEKDLRLLFSDSMELTINNLKTKGRTIIDLDLKNESCVLYRNDRQITEVVKVNKSNQWLIKKDGTVLNP